MNVDMKPQTLVFFPFMFKACTVLKGIYRHGVSSDYYFFNTVVFIHVNTLIEHYASRIKSKLES